MKNVIAETKTAQLKRTVKSKLSNIEKGIKTAIGSAWDAGEILTELKTRAKHGEWLPLLEAVGVGERQSQKYMRLFKEIPREIAIENQTINKALEGISTPKAIEDASSGADSDSKSGEGDNTGEGTPKKDDLDTAKGKYKIDRYTFNRIEKLARFVLENKTGDFNESDIDDAFFLTSVFEVANNVDYMERFSSVFKKIDLLNSKEAKQTKTETKKKTTTQKK